MTASLGGSIALEGKRLHFFFLFFLSRGGTAAHWDTTAATWGYAHGSAFGPVIGV